MKRRLIAVALVAAAVAAILIVSLTGGASAETSEQVETPPTMAEIQQAALRAAALSGELAPTSIEETSGTLGQTSRVLDPQDAGNTITDPRTGRPWVDSSVYVVTMQGQFTFNGPTPANRPLPKGTVLTVILDAKSGALVGESLTNSSPDMHEINPSVARLGAGQ